MRPFEKGNSSDGQDSAGVFASSVTARLNEMAGELELEAEDMLDIGDVLLEPGGRGRRG